MTDTTFVTRSSNQTPIEQFYKDQHILITGGTGFLGKLLVEKLLRSCPELSTIYIIIRSKKGQDANSRLDSLFDCILFETLKKEVPNFRDKVFALEGDCSVPGLGISISDKELIVNKVSIVFHVAATVRFDEKIRYAVAINVQGTKEVIELCRSVKNLKSVVHVSTAYSNCNRSVIEDKFYEPPINGDNIIKLVQCLDDTRLEAIMPILLGEFPNTYTFTKCIAEQLMQQYGRDLPSGIFRPAIVTSTYREPFPGWVDNTFGIAGIIAGGGAGLIRTMNAAENSNCEIVPVDFTVNALIAMAWDIADIKSKDADPIIYNYHSNWTSNLTWGRFFDLSTKYGRKTPCLQSLSNYNVTIIKNYYIYYILSTLLHVLPAAIMDFVLFIAGKETRMLKTYKKIHKLTDATAYFTTHQWIYRNENTVALWDKLTADDKRKFYFSMKNFDWEDFISKLIKGIRVHIFKEGPETIPMAKRRMAKIDFIQSILKYTLLALILWIVYTITNTIFSDKIVTGVASLAERYSYK